MSGGCTIRFGAGLAIAAVLCGQSLDVAPSKAERGGYGSFLIALKAGDGKKPVALQWDLGIPAGVEVDLKDLVAGSAAESADKSLVCASRPEEAPKGGQGCRCILSGGQKAIANGVVAVIKYKVQAAFHGSTATLKVDNAMGVTAALERIEIGSSGGTLTVK